MVETKIRLTIILQGRVPVSSVKTDKNSKQIFKNAKQVINITKEAYNHFISECPAFVKPFIWSKMKRQERLEAYLNNIKEHFNGKSYYYEVLND